MAIIGTNSTTGMSLFSQTSVSTQKLTQDSGYIYLAGSNEEVFRVAYHNRSTQVGDGSGVQVGVYNLGTGPTVDGATLIASGTVTAVASSWCTLDITPVALVAGNYYAVAMRVISATNVDTSRIALTNGTSTRGSGATALTSPWTLALSTTSFLYAMYAETRTTAGGTANITSISSNNTIYANSSNVVVTGTSLANGVYAKLVYANQEILMVDYVANSTQPYFTSPSLADVFASRIQFTDSANLQILDAQSGIVATKIVSFQPPLTKTVHNVTDVSQASNVGSIYYGQSPAITVNDQLVYDANSTSNYSVFFDSQGYITIDSLDTDANDSFTYSVYESSSQVWGTEGTITFLGPS